MASGAYYVREATSSSSNLLAANAHAWLPADRIAWGAAPYRTSFRALWNLDALFLRFDANDPSPWSTMSDRDDPLWDEEVVEIFLDLDGTGTHYAEIELSPANVVTDVRMVRGSPDKQMDLDWDFDGLETTVTTGDGSWVGCLRLPWDGFRSLPSSRDITLPPTPGDRWRFNVYRIERPGGAAAPDDDVAFQAYSPTGSPSFHVPASFQGFEFS